MTFSTSSTRMENVAREEGYEAGYEDGLAKYTPISLGKADTLIGEYGLAVNSMDSERMRLACKALFGALTGRKD